MNLRQMKRENKRRWDARLAEHSGGITFTIPAGSLDRSVVRTLFGQDWFCPCGALVRRGRCRACVARP
jgi:hypothetical protein